LGLKNQDIGTFALFGDPLQDVYGTKNLMPWLNEIKELSVNYRNSIEIYSFLEKLVDLSEQSCLGTSIQNINQCVVNNNDEIITNLVSEIDVYKKNGILSNQVTVLCINSDTKKIIENSEEMKQYIFDGVTVESVRRYTGLENDVIILVVPDKSVFPATINESRTKNYLYVAASRARSALSIISTKEFFEEFLA
jgi:superfamily I DNA/RNA helicase